MAALTSASRRFGDVMPASRVDAVDAHEAKVCVKVFHGVHGDRADEGLGGRPLPAKHQGPDAAGFTAWRSRSAVRDVLAWATGDAGHWPP